MQSITTTQLRNRLYNAFDAFVWSDNYDSQFIYNGREYEITDNAIGQIGSGIYFDLSRNPETGNKVYNNLKADEYTIPAVLENNERIINLLNQ